MDTRLAASATRTSAAVGGEVDARLGALGENLDLRIQELQVLSISTRFNSVYLLLAGGLCCLLLSGPACISFHMTLVSMSGMQAMLTTCLPSAMQVQGLMLSLCKHTAIAGTADNV